MNSPLAYRTLTSTLAGLVALIGLISAPGLAQAQTFNVTPLRVGAPPPAAPAPAKAQAAPAFEWSGFYLGGTVGFGDGKADTTFRPSSGVLSPDTVQPDTQGFVYGFYGGMNFQGGIFVGGVEADVMFSQMDGSQQNSTFTFNGATFNGAQSAAQEINWFSTVRGRAGVGVGGFHVYGTAGVAMAKVDHRSNLTPVGAAQYPIEQVDTKLGWAIGGGLEGQFNRVVTWRVQYLHLDVGSTTATANPVPSGGSLTVDHTWLATSNVFTGGIGFKF